MPCSSRIISEMLPEIHTMKKFDFLKPINNSQITLFSVHHGTTRCVRLYMQIDFVRAQDHLILSGSGSHNVVRCIYTSLNDAADIITMHWPYYQHVGVYKRI